MATLHAVSDGCHCASSLGDDFTTITAEKCQHLVEKGFTVIDGFLDIEFACSLRQELVMLTRRDGVMIPNRTHFSSPTNPSKHYLFAKPGIFEVDMHQTEIRSLVPENAKLFEMSKTLLVEALQRRLKDDVLLHQGDSGRTIKLQLNKGGGGCFPCHYDNPGPPSKRCLTCVLYLNPDWKEGDGGEITLFPFLDEPVRIAPRMNRLVIFKSNRILHRVEPSWKVRYCLTIWIDGENTNRPEDVQLRLPKSALSDVDATVFMLKDSPLQRSLSRAVYREEYEKSLNDCMEGAQGWEEMLEAHRAHLKQVEGSQLLADLVEALRHWRRENCPHLEPRATLM